MADRSFRRLGFVCLGLLLTVAVAAQEPKPALTFIVTKSDKMEFRWRLQEKEGTLLAVSDQAYLNKETVRDAVEQVRKLAASNAVKYEIRQDAKMLYRWTLKTDKGQVLAESGDGYQDRVTAEKLISVIKAGAKEALVVDKTTN